MEIFKLILLSVVVILILVLLLIFLEVLWARVGKSEPFNNPDPTPVSFGSSKQILNYLVLGDSLAAGQGADYQRGIAVKTSEHLAQKYSVALTNLAVSGATSTDLLVGQIPQIKSLKPDLVMISLGANDLTKLTSTEDLKQNLKSIVGALVNSNCQVKIVLTGVPDVGASPRFLQPLKFIIDLRANRLQREFTDSIAQNNLTLAPIAKETGFRFREDHTLYSIDLYHPNERGYVLWTEVINIALDQALLNQPAHCDTIN